MQKNKIYKIIDSSHSESISKYTIRIDFSNSILKGHFPKKPVLPGVVMCDIIRDLASIKLGVEIQLVNAKNIKFMKMIIPSKNEKYIVNISINKDNNYKIKATISQNNEIHFKLSGEYYDKKICQKNSV